MVNKWKFINLGFDLDERKEIFKGILNDEEFIDRRINIAELIEPETDSDNENLNFVDQYNVEVNIWFNKK
jgi:protein phosphatase 1 regulatory subunit 7